MEMPVDQENKVFSSVNMAMDAKKDGVAIVMRRNDTSGTIMTVDILKRKYNNPNSKVTEQQIIEIALKSELERLADEAMESGASLLISKEQIKDYPCLLVPDVKIAFFKLAVSYVGLFNIKKIQITGSYGKTSMWQLITHVLVVSGKNVHKNALNFNDHRGVINAIFKLEHDHEYYIQETQEGPIPWVVELASMILKPDIGIITNIGATHLSHMQTKDRIARCALKIEGGMPADGLLILNGDDYLIKREARIAKVPIVYYGTRYINVDYLATNIQQSYDGISFDISYGEDKTETRRVKMATIGEHNAYNALAVFATCKKLGLTEDEIINGIESFKSEGIRQNLTNVNGRTLYLDCYNASIETMIATIKIISEITLKEDTGRRVAILGNINELAGQNEVGHKQVGYAALQSDIDILICYGYSAALIGEIAQENPNIQVFTTEDYDYLIQLIREETRPGDFILVKASRGSYMENAVDIALGTYFGFDAEESTKSNEIVTIGDFLVNVNANRTTITGYAGSGGEIHIPHKLNDNILFGISKEAFANNHSITHVVIPKTLKVIGEHAFCGCANLTKVQVPVSVVNIGEGAFADSPCVIWGKPGSFAESYAYENSIEFAKDIEYTIADIAFKSVNIDDVNDLCVLELINTWHKIKSVPEKSKFVKAEYFTTVVKNDIVVAHKQVMQMAKNMLDAAKKGSVDKFYVIAGYRNLEEQGQLYEQNPKDGTTAQPWHSEHHSGLALDIFPSSMAVKSDEIVKDSTPQFKWLADNAHRFGFILRYPEGKENITGVPYEAWHFRYVGRVHAYYMWQNNLVFEEYIGLLKERKQITVDIYGTQYYVFYQMLENGFIQVPQGIEYDVSSDNTGGYIITADPITFIAEN